MIRESEVQQGIEDWNKRLVDEVLRGPSPTLHGSINPLCSAAFGRGLLTEDGKFGLVREVAGIMYCIQPNGKPTKPLEELNLEEMARIVNSDPQRVRTVVGLMREFNFIPRRNGSSR